MSQLFQLLRTLRTVILTYCHVNGAKEKCFFLIKYLFKLSFALRFLMAKSMDLHCVSVDALHQNYAYISDAYHFNKIAFVFTFFQIGESRSVFAR